MASSAHAGEGGAALVEAALVLPILLLLGFGVAEVSLYFWSWGLAAKAVQLGVRRAVLSSSVAVGPGLDPADSERYWDGLPPGASCSPAPGGVSPCPDFSVRCGLADGCHCSGNACRFRLAAGRFAPIVEAMRAVMPDLQPANVEISYTTNGLGYVTRPGPASVDVRVRLVGLRYTPLFFGDLLGASLPLRASAWLPSESLGTR